MQRGPPLPRQIAHKSDPPSGGSASIPPTWVSVSTESLPLVSGPLGHRQLSGTKICPVPKEEAGAHACSVVRPDDDMRVRQKRKKVSES